MYRLSDEEAERFARCWSLLDPRGRMRLPEDAVVTLLAQLPAPLGSAPANAPPPPDTSRELDGTASAWGRSALTPKQLCDAEALLRRLPLPQPEVAGFIQVRRVHASRTSRPLSTPLPPPLPPQFHALLHALLDVASDAPPLGAAALPEMVTARRPGSAAGSTTSGITRPTSAASDVVSKAGSDGGSDVQTGRGGGGGGETGRSAQDESGPLPMTIPPWLTPHQRRALLAPLRRAPRGSAESDGGGGGSGTLSDAAPLPPLSPNMRTNSTASLGPQQQQHQPPLRSILSSGGGGSRRGIAGAGASTRRFTFAGPPQGAASGGGASDLQLTASDAEDTVGSARPVGTPALRRAAAPPFILVAVAEPAAAQQQQQQPGHAIVMQPPSSAASASRRSLPAQQQPGPGHHMSGPPPHPPLTPPGAAPTYQLGSPSSSLPVAAARGAAVSLVQQQQAGAGGARMDLEAVPEAAEGADVVEVSDVSQGPQGFPV